jgi:hypothetical protein
VHPATPLPEGRGKGEGERPITRTGSLDEVQVIAFNDAPTTPIDQ